MSNEQSEVRAGDVWMFGGREETVYDIDGDQIVACKVGMKDGNFTHYGRGCCWRPRQSMSYGRLISRAESCKEPECKAPAWCGYRHGDRDDPRRALYQATNIIGTNHNDRIYCSPDCPNVPRSPLSAQEKYDMGIPHPKGCMCEQCKPAPGLAAKEERRCAGGCGIILRGAPRELCATCKPAPAAKAAKPAKKLSCIKHHDRPGTPYAYDTRTFLFCGECQDAATAWLRAQDGTPCDQPPGLLPKPRMAHVANQDWDVGSEVE